MISNELLTCGWLTVAIASCFKTRKWFYIFSCVLSKNKRFQCTTKKTAFFMPVGAMPLHNCSSFEFWLIRIKSDMSSIIFAQLIYIIFTNLYFIYLFSLYRIVVYSLYNMLEIFVSLPFLQFFSIARFFPVFHTLGLPNYLLQNV